MIYKQDSVCELSLRDEEAYTLPDKDWFRAARGTVVCENCFRLRSSVHPRPVDIVLSSIAEEAPYHAVFNGGVGVIRNDLLDLLQPHMQDYVLGECRISTDRTSRYRSIYFRRRLRVRARPDSANYTHFQCPICLSESEAADDRYVNRGDIREDSVFQDNCCGLYFSEPLASTFPWDRFPVITNVRIAVV